MSTSDPYGILSSLGIAGQGSSDGTINTPDSQSAGGARDAETSYQNLLTMLRRDLLLGGAELQPNSVGPSELAEVPYCNLGRVNSLSIPYATATPIVWDTPTPINLRGNMAYNVSSGAVTVPISGLYMISLTWNWAAFAGGVSGTVYRLLEIGSTTYTIGTDAVPAGGVPPTQHYTTATVLPANTAVTAAVAQTNSAIGAESLAAATITTPNSFIICFLSNYA